VGWDPAVNEEMIIETERLLMHPATQRQLRFLQRLWNDPQVMRYAGFPRNWDYERMKVWYEKYRGRVATHGGTEVQFVFRLKMQTLIGESGLGRLRTGWKCRDYNVPQGKTAVMTDIKLAKPFWRQGYGTEAMRAITRYVFTETDGDVLLVPPHRDNQAATKLYEKVGFRRTEGIYYRHHMIYEMTKGDFEEIYARKGREE